MLKRTSSIFILILLISSIISYAQEASKCEFRGVWIATVGNIDWPSKPGLSPKEQRREFRQLIKYHKLSGMNAVIVQIRPCADAFYPSVHEPWSQWLTGGIGEPPAPYYDPLQFMIEVSREYGMEFHAWLNPYRALINADNFFAHSTHLTLSEFKTTPDSVLSNYDTLHFIYENPDWYIQYGNRLYFDPGLPEVQAHITQVVGDIVTRYDVDAIHMDDYFYPYKIRGEVFADTASFRKYGLDYDSTEIDDWRRKNVDIIVEKISDTIKAINPRVKFGISPFGVWRNASVDPRGSDTRAGQTNYDDLYADILKWLENKWIDYVVPQLYWPIGFELADYETLAHWWNKNSYGRHLYIGHGLYRVDENSQDETWHDPEEIIRQINLNRSLANINGSAYFSSRSVIENKLDVRNNLINARYKTPALVPKMPWLDSIPPAPTGSVEVKVVGDGCLVDWDPVENAHEYVIYRYRRSKHVDIENPLSIIATIPDGNTFYHDATVQNRKKYVYVVTVTDQLHNESLPTISNRVKFRLKE